MHWGITQVISALLWKAGYPRLLVDHSFHDEEQSFGFSEHSVPPNALINYLFPYNVSNAMWENAQFLDKPNHQN